jgi:hypothetical protein
MYIPEMLDICFFFGRPWHTLRDHRESSQAKKGAHYNGLHGRRKENKVVLCKVFERQVQVERFPKTMFTVLVTQLSFASRYSTTQ